jgi:hypothetical protein
MHIHKKILSNQQLLGITYNTPPPINSTILTVTIKYHCTDCWQVRPLVWNMSVNSKTGLGMVG